MPTLANNKQVHFDYEILETIEAGLVLTGQEAKSVKAGHMNLKGAFVTFHGSEALLTNAHISKYPQAGPLPDYDPTRSRRLLIHKREIERLRGKLQEKGLTIVPTEVYTKNRFIKVKIGIARGKHLYDKRQTLKKRDAEREIRRTLKNSN